MAEFHNPQTSRRTGTTILCVIVPIFILTFTAFVLLTLTTFSLPFVTSLYFLWVSQAGGARFGIWGWCLDEGVCSDTLGLGYTWEPEIAIPITKALALYPVAAISAFLMLIALIPILRDRGPRTLRVFAIFAWSSFLIAFLAFVFMIAMWAVADERFKKAGWEVRWGPLPWMSFVATMLLLIVALNSWRGVLSSLYSEQDPNFSREDWAATATQSKEFQPRETDPEKAMSVSPSSTSITSSVKETAQLSASPTEGHKVFVDVALHSPTKEEYAQARRHTNSWSHRHRHDGFLESKSQQSRTKRSSQPSSVPFPLTSDIPRYSRAQNPQKSHHSQLTPLRTT